MRKIYTVAIVGVGSRGADAYGTLINDLKDRFDIVSLCDPKQERLDRFGKIFGVAPENRFADENEFFKVKRADVIIIATLDNDHVRQTVKALGLGYDILVEKPLTGKKEDCELLLGAQKKYGGKVLVCHVLRYAKAFLKVAELIDEGKIGKLVAVDALERVAYWHQAHSYVRGNWRNNEVAMPMILAKCCHDLDLLQFYAKSKCKSISSVGDLAFFNKDNAPEGSASRCVDCKYADDCEYSAKIIYPVHWEQNGSPENCWPYNVLCPAPVTKEKLYEAIKSGPYGRCVFKCDNDVVDHQITQMTFENGVKATLTMTAFTSGMGRRMHFFGTLGEIILDEENHNISLRIFGKQNEEIDTDKIIDKENGFGHGGGDYGLINSLYGAISGETNAATSLSDSIESHLMGICAEESRKQGGKLIFVHEK